MATHLLTTNVSGEVRGILSLLDLHVELIAWDPTHSKITIGVVNRRDRSKRTVRAISQTASESDRLDDYVRSLILQHLEDYPRF